MDSSNLILDYLKNIDRVIDEVEIKYINQSIEKAPNGNPVAVYDLYEAHSGGRMDYYVIITSEGGRMVIKAPDDLLTDRFGIKL